MNSTLFCNLEALTPQQRQRHSELAKKLRPLVAEFRELAAGYAAELRSPHNLELCIEEFMTLERLCCPFFELKLENENRDEAEQAYILTITGRGDIKPFIRGEFGIPENENAT